MDQAELQPSGQLAFGPWWLLYHGAIRNAGVHSHHSLQLVVCPGTSCVGGGEQQALAGPVAVIPPHERHALVDEIDTALIVFIDPDSSAYNFLMTRRIAADSHAERNDVANLLHAVGPGTWHQAEQAVIRVLGAVCDSSFPAPTPTWRDQTRDAAWAALTSLAVADSSESERARGPNINHGWEAECGASPNWLRLVDGALRLRLGHTMAESARAAGFADGAHLSGAFRAMFGFSPTEAVEVSGWLWP